MAGPVIVLELILIAAFGLLVLCLLYATISSWGHHKTSIPTGLTFLALVSVAAYVYAGIKKNEYQASKKFLGYYKLNMLDGKKCNECKVRLTDGYVYEILVDNYVVGRRKWSLGTAVDIPGYFLEIENAPTNLIWEEDRTIDFINRKGK